MTAGITPAELGGQILRALGEGAPGTGEEQLLAGLATLLAGRYRAAAPLLRQAIGMLAADPGPRDRVPVWLMGATFAATAIWEDRFALGWMARCEDLARPCRPSSRPDCGRATPPPPRRSQSSNTAPPPAGQAGRSGCSIVPRL